MPTVKRQVLLGLTSLGIFCVFLAAPTRAGAQAAESPVGSPVCGGSSTVDTLGTKAAANYRDFLSQLQAASKAGDKEKVAAMVNFPLLVVRDGKRTRIHDRTIFLAQYDQILTPPVRNAIARQSTACLFGNDMGAMVGNGEVWFVEQYPGMIKIITVNESASAR